MRRFVPWICLLLVLVPLAVTSSTPSPPPLNSFRLDGKLLTSHGFPIAGAKVAFATRCQGSMLVLDDLNGCTCNQGEKPGHPSDQTAPDGSFSLDLVSCEVFDSLAVVTVYPDHAVTRDVYAVKDAQRSDWNQQVPDQSTSYFFCATSTGFTTARIGTVYAFSNRTVMTSDSSP